MLVLSLLFLSAAVNAAVAAVAVLLLVQLVLVATLYLKKLASHNVVDGAAFTVDVDTAAVAVGVAFDVICWQRQQ